MGDSQVIREVLRVGGLGMATEDSGNGTSLQGRMLQDGFFDPTLELERAGLSLDQVLINGKITSAIEYLNQEVRNFQFDSTDENRLERLKKLLSFLVARQVQGGDQPSWEQKP